MLRRVLSLFLAMTLLLSNMPVASFAEQLEVANEDTVIAQSDADLPDGNGNTDESIEIPESVGEDVVLEQQDAPETNESDVTPILGGASDVEAYGTADEDAENEFVSVSGIYLNESEIQLTITDKPIQLLVIIEPENADNQTIAWSSSNPDVADVMAGVVTPLAVGEATVTAVSEDGNFSASCLITVTGSADLETYGEAEDESSIRTSAVNGTWGSQIQWYFDEDTGLLTIGGSGDMPDCNSGGTDAPWYQYKSSIVKVEITDGITAIGENTFRQYTTLEEVTLPDSLVKIGTFAFDGNTKLSSIQLNKVETIGNSAFSNCASLGNVSLDSAKTVEPQAFVSCSALTSVTLGSDSNRVELVGKQAFGKCAALKTVNFKNVKELGEESFTQSGLTSADLSSVEIIGKKAFSADTSLTSVTFGNAAIQIGNQAFSKTGLISVDLPGGATLDNYAFYNCASLTEVVLGEGITAIPASCFNGATALESVTIPVSLQTVGANAFAKCTKLKAAHYAGTQAQWNNVTVNAGNDCLTALMDRRNIAVTGISLDKAELELKLKDEPAQLVATITPNDATNTSVVWTSNNEKVATVDAVGKVTPIEVGEAVITATTNDGGFQASCKVRVIAADSESGNIDLTKFQFSLYSAEMADSICADISLTVRQTEDGSYALYAPSYAVEYTTDAKSIMVQAPEDFQTPFTVTYTSWAGGVEHEETVHSENGTVNITGYYDGWGKNTSGLVDGAPALKYSDFSFSFEGSSNSVSLSFSLYNSLREIIVENQETYDRLGNITRTDASTYEVHLVRNESYKIYVSGGFRQIFADSNCSISNGVDTQQSVRAAEIIYTPGEETSKDFEIRITSRESSYGIAEGVYKLHIIVDDPPEAKPVFEKYIYTLNGIEYEAVNDSGTYNIPRITQYDKLSIKAVVSNVGDDTVYHWTRWNTALEENEATIKVDTTSSRKDSYQFKCRLTLSSGYEYKLPDICVVFLDIVNIPPPAILTQPVGGEYPIGAQVSLSVLTAYPEEGIPQFQWYSCDDENGSNAQAIKDATDSTRRLDGYLSGYVAPSDEVGTKWYYCEINSYYFNDQVYPKVKTSCVKVEIVKNKLPLDGEGTSDKPYLITSADDLIAIREAVADGNAFVGQHFEFEKDVTLPNDWQPIGCTKDGSNLIDKGNNLNAFSGIIDGAGHTLTIPAGGLPLLGYVWNASVSNLNIYGSQIDGYGLVNSYHGYGLDGTAIVIDNVTLKTGTQTKKAGLIGAELNSENAFGGASASCTVTIRNCTVEDGVVIGYGKDQSMIGAIAGRLHGVIENCKSGATVYGVNYVGGILGCRDNALGLCSVSGCTFDGSVVASGDHAGGIVGGGYTNQTAPNGIKVTANNNTVTGSITGHDKVGGILGGDTYVAQAWNAYSLKANNFSGTVSATGGKYVGGIIGYYKSLNKWDDILGNTYSNTDKGIGFVLYVDTSCETATGMDGTVIFNSGNGTDDLPTVAGCAWRADHNRTDDPLGKDVDKLFKKVGGGEVVKPTCYEIRVSGTYQTKYTVGDKLNLSGIKLTAVWTDGTTTELKLSDVEISGYDKNKAGEQTVSLSYGLGKAQITVTVIPKSTKITVSVTIKGDSKHGTTSSPHGLARGGLTTWASESGVEADTSETVWDVLQRVAKKHNITITASDNNAYHTVYISAVNGLGEFDNGKNSGWMYTVNGTHPEVGVAAKYLKNGDNIVLHYTDDYDYEEGGNKYGQKPSGGTTTGGGSTGGTTTGGTTGTTTGGTSMITAADRNKAAAVDKLIEKIGTVTKDSGPAIEAARKAYNDLTPTQKRLVTKLKELTDAEKAYAKLTATAEDQQKAKDVMDKISKIGNVTKDSEQDIKDARKAYDALTDLQKLLVDNYDVLTAAETKFAMLDTLGKVSEPYISTGEYMEKLGTPNVGAIGGEWMVIGLARSGRTVPGVEDYYQKAVEYVQQSIDPDTGRLHKAKSTDNSRMILALTAIGKDVTNVGGYNLLAGLSDLEFVKYQGNNGPIWALLALDSGNYPVPSGGTTTRQALIDEILSVQTSDGGWAISGDRADSDMTGMALTALAPYYKKDPAVKQAIDKAIARLSEMQDDDGGFSTTYGDGKYIATSESTAQVLTALSALGIDADTDSRFVKNGSSVVDALLRYYVKGGGFKHIMDGEIDGMGTEQAYYALTAYYRFLSGKTNLYDMTDIIDMGGDVVTVEPTVPAATEPAQAAQTNIPWWIIAVCIFGGAGWGVVIGIVLVPKLNKKKD